MSVDLDQAFRSSLKNEISNSHSNEATLQSFKPFPNEILPLIFDQLTAFERCLILSVCRNWNAILLAGRGFWQIVQLSLRLSISTAISILQIFNLRSGFSLKEVLFEPIIREVKDVDRIFEELRKSSSTVRVLALPQLARLNTQTRNLARNLLPVLHFLYSNDHRGHPILISVMWKDLLKWKSQRSGINLSNEGDTEVPGLRYYSTNSLDRVGKEEETWFRKLQFLEVQSTRSLEDLHSILEASKSSLQELDVSGWGEELKDSENVDLPMISMDNSNGMKFHLPHDASAARALSRFLKFRGQVQVQVSGTLASFLSFQIRYLSSPKVYLYYEGDAESIGGPSMTPQVLKEKTDLFLKTNPSLLTLVLVARSSRPGPSFHLNHLLERLIVPSNSSSTQQHGSPNATQRQDPLLLPKLKAIVIDEPSELNGKLLRKCLQSRRKLSPSFKLLVWSKGGYVKKKNWRGQSWMK